ncbi:MAG: hypothetical protein Marn2KO_36190 [Marinobacter nauticus]
MPLVSIVLPVYNGADYLDQSIDSIRKQDLEDLELIIINDCSTDNSAEIARAHAAEDPRIQVHDNPENLRLPKSLNEGFKRAKGSYWSWTSHDNLYRPDALRRLTETLAADKDAVLVASDYSLIDDKGTVKRLRKLSPIETMIAGNAVGACFLYRADIAQKVGGYATDLFLAEDYEYWLRLGLEGKILYLSEDLYMYRHHGDSLTSTRQADIRRMDAIVKARYLPLMPDAPKGAKVSACRQIFKFHPNTLTRLKFALHAVRLRPVIILKQLGFMKPAANPASEPKVFVIGWQKTATSSVAHALAEHGIHCHTNVDEATQMFRGTLSLSDWLHSIDAHTGLKDFPGTYLYRELEARYPDAKFILTTRDEAGWLKSLIKHVSTYGSNDLINALYGTDMTDLADSPELQATALTIYRKHLHNVRMYFENRPDKLLEVDLRAPDAYDRFASFLGDEKKLDAFPRANVIEGNPELHVKTATEST